VRIVADPAASAPWCERAIFLTPPFELGSGPPSPPDEPGLEFTLPSNMPQYTMEHNVPHFTLPRED
jgi:hypothetical protein